ncbi:hypothetical protein PN4B1_22960 [Paenibacillus naphthalenovorans]|nr:hypothetical protein PN4B1_22960 [Paenibacillus naphthalenovorans]
MSFFVVISFFLQLLFVVGLIWIISALNVFIRDIGQIIPVVILLLMMVSPIGYTKEMIPEKMLPYMQFNPLYFMVEMYREPLIMNKLPDVHTIIVFSIVSFCTFVLGFIFFRRLKEVFADYV